ncbi:MAG TPA: BatD family protein [Anaerolineae bacterium]|nr:BatD family protein [Anaerolineae bacterium]
MMKPKFKYLLSILVAVLILPLVGTGAVQAQAQSPIHAEVDRTALSTDEVLVLTVTVSSTTVFNTPAPKLPDLQGFQVVGTSSSSQISIVNANITSQLIWVYHLQPYETGDLVIGPVSVTLDGQTHSSEPITVHVTQGTGAAVPAPAAPSDKQPVEPAAELNGQDLFVEAVVDNPMPYVGQQVTYTLRFYQAVNLWDQPGYEPPAFTGFWSERQPGQQEYQAQAGGRIYRVAEVHTILFPSVVGPVTIDPARLTIPGGFFSSGRTLQTKPVELNVQPLPVDAPTGFGGAVGQFTVTASLDTAQGTVNEPLTWQVTLSGQGNVNAAPDPVWPEIPGWRSFESEASVNTEVRSGQMIGTRVYERLLVPNAEGEYAIPPLEYVYFDPIAGQYQTTGTEPLPVSIAPGVPGTAATQPQARSNLAGGQKEAVEQIATDIRHLKPVPSSLGSGDGPVTASSLYWAAWAFPLLGAAGYFAWQRRQRYWENNLSLARSSRARKKARKALDLARKQKQDAHRAAGQILIAYLADKLDQPVAGLTHQALIDLLTGHGVGPDLCERVEVLLVTSELGRFAPGVDEPGHAQSLLQEVDVLIGALEKVL